MFQRDRLLYFPLLMPVTECLPIFDTGLPGFTAVFLSDINICTWNLTAKNQQPNPLTDCSSNTASEFYQQTCEEGMVTLWDREASSSVFGAGVIEWSELWL